MDEGIEGGVDDVRLAGTFGQRDLQVTSTGNWQRFSVVGPARAVSAEIDPDDKIRMDTNELNDSRTVEANGDASRRWFRDFTMLLQSLFALLATV